MKPTVINKKILLTNAGTTIVQSIVDYNLNNFKAIYATDVSSDCYVAKKLGKKRFFIVPPFNKWLEFRKEIVKICKKNKIDMIIPCGNDDELIRFARDVDFFKDFGIDVLVSNFQAIKICYDKVMCNDFVVKCGIKVPQTYFLDESPNKMNFALLLKKRRGAGSMSMQIIKNREDLLYFRQKNKNCILQKIISGPEYSLDMVLNNNSEIIVASCRERLATMGGICIKANIIENNNIIDKASIIAKKLKLIGPINVQFIKDYFIEINPRFPGGMGIIMKAGFNMPLLAVKSFYGHPISKKETRFKKIKIVRIWKEYEI